jgi:thiamine transport system permease protein
MACVLAGIASLWAFGEFALGRVLLSQNLNWALLSESLMSSYRIEAGLGVGFLILFSGGLLFTFFWRLGDVGR